MLLCAPHLPEQTSYIRYLNDCFKDSSQDFREQVHQRVIISNFNNLLEEHFLNQLEKTIKMKIFSLRFLI